MSRLLRRYLPFVIAGVVLGVFLSYTKDQPTWVRYVGFLVIFLAVVVAVNFILRKINPTDRDVALRGR